MKNRPPKYEIQNKDESNKSRGCATINILKILGQWGVVLRITSVQASKLFKYYI